MIKNLKNKKNVLRTRITSSKLLTKHKNVFFSKSKGDLGHTYLVQHQINTRSVVPIRQSLRRLPYGKRQTEKEKILRMLDLGVIESFI